MHKNNSLFEWVAMGMYAALIILAITFIHIPMPSAISKSFVHPGNALVVLGVLLMGEKRGTLAAAAGLFLYDVLNGYASVAIFTVLENLVVIAVVSLLFRKVFHSELTIGRLASIGVVAGVTKVIVIFIKYTFRQVLLGNSLAAAMAIATTGMPASLFTAAVTAVLVTLLYYPMKKVVDRYPALSA
ncbi:ECF transporter S component [Aerococcus urinae]|uniref:ECF transporter S component n=2 Tax=Aerococcus urinae TaxID=1376 RepID=A0A0X8FEY6_9LACT|nr:ECF transporter S component [Aerococcus urinae]AMB96077.1 hypothetical protein AWM73_05945 [Aerococcus urinae]MCY3033343.1 ECF transporter S component [Aerococcus urinae]MCY3038535.1 ECF transporter S component [Aerococcus urinae]MCY3045309.1 ECF transporter S component [Aerococcus urinae]MCY3047041.1 ECF transporter S component [Aerococcus urinae]